MQIGPCVPVGIQLEKAEVGPSSGRTWRLSHMMRKHAARAQVKVGAVQALETGAEQWGGAAPIAKVVMRGCCSGDGAAGAAVQAAGPLPGKNGSSQPGGSRG
jgi:hypothetical protein